MDAVGQVRSGCCTSVLHAMIHSLPIAYQFFAALCGQIQAIVALPDGRPMAMGGEVIM